jgi:hypothetical protein
MVDITNKITMRLRPFCEATGLGPSKIYELIAAKEIESFTAGKARLIVVQSYFDYIKRQQQIAPPLPSPNPRAGSRDPTVAATRQTELPPHRSRPPKSRGASPAPQPQIGASRGRGRRRKDTPPTSPHPVSARDPR